MPRVSTRFRRPATVLAALVLAAAGVLLPAVPAFAAVLGIDKSTIGVPADGLEPGGSFTYAIRVDCTSLSEDCQNVTVTDTLPAEFTADIVPGAFTWSGGPETVPPGGTVFPGVPAYTYTYDATTGDLTFTVASVPAGTSTSVQVGMTLPADTTVPDGTVVPNTATVSADNAPPASDSVNVEVNVPVVPDVRATKDWADGSALAGSGEASTVTLGITNASAGAAAVTSMTLTDQTNGNPATDPWNYFDLTGFGAVTYPAGADQVQIQYCTLPYPQACGGWTAGAVQTGSPIQADAGVDLAAVTGVRFVFSSSTGGPIPNDASGSVAFTLKLRDTERVDGTTPIEPTQTQTITDSATPSVTNAGGTTDGDPATDTYQIVPNIASIDMSKSWFADADGDFQPDNPPSAPAQRRWPVSAVVTATNTSPFPVETMTVREPSTTDPESGLTVVDVTQIRLRFPDGAATAHVTVTCADGSTVVKDIAAPPATAVLNRPADFTCPAVGPDDPGMKVTSIEVVYASPPGTAAIDTNATAGLDFHGTLDNNAVPGNSPYNNCADATAVNTGNGSTSATASACGLLTVTAGTGPSGPGTKTVSQQELPEDTPIDYTITFHNDGGDLNDFALVDPPNVEDLTEDTQPFATARINSITGSCPTSPADIVLLIPDTPNPARQVPYATATAADLDAARGFFVRADPLPAGADCNLQIEVERRPGITDSVTITNCYLVLAGGGPAINGSIQDSTDCAPAVVTSPPRSAASLQKFIEPADVPRPTPGLDPPAAAVKLRVANTGNTHLKSLTVTDSDDDGAGSDFFRSFDYVAMQGVSFPPGADLVQFDACTTGCAAGTWIAGTPTAANPPPLPGGASPADVRGIRVTFTSSDPAHGGFNLTPGENFPTTGPCVQASVCFTVTPRATDRETGEPVLGTYTDTADGHGQANSTIGGDFDIPAVTADLTVTEGRPAIDVDKAVVGQASIAPGQTGIFDLTVTSTGTAALPDLEVSDPIPAELEFDETGVNGQPYAIQRLDVPAGTTPPGPEQFTPQRDADGRVTRLVWKFPGLFAPTSVLVIRIGMRMAPGTAAGTTATNTMGAGSSSTNQFDCSGSPPDGTVTGDPFLPGRNCTSPASLTTTAGASFSASKWSAGNPDLGLYDNVRAKFTPLDDPLCPHLTRAGVVFTRYPCIPLVYPGQNFTFLARMTNNGTFAALDARVVDVLPAPGDTGVIDPSDRGTMWDVPPQLVAPPTVTPTPGSTIDTQLTYSTASPPCTDDLSPPAACPAGAWVPGFDPAATGVQAYAQFPAPGLAPGAAFDLTWQMTSPTDLDQPVSPSIAWNSFGHTELIDTPGTPRQLGAVEPQKAGIGLVFGGVRIIKTVTAEPGATVPTGSYELAYTCTVTPDTGDPVQVRTGTAEFGPDQPWELDGVPAHATCVIYETDPRGGATDHPESDPLTIIIPWDATAAPATAAVTNTFVAPPPPPPPVPSPTADGGELPRTGASLLPITATGVAAVLSGLVLLAGTAVRRRRPR
ncbi:putative repeat protein (TIGR01451 family) [Allocatelliglobosispora scoriae]|uniref:Putative repeat protein (TIGR01451 family) n=1 Tax=Allocatelliglobosispora scoriae TaxID=643052 RepID=A0A841BJR4_9ACTN|nr:DUF5979 domain-containing protein [Allocatelliglobosispora scoriae]MBB5868504.1 putative repeat protein (TIGR01451 family) [Allocatelliglobosispora scoriae]